MNDIDPQLLDKLQKIMELAVRGGTQGEMEAAMARASEIARKHGIDLAKLPPRPDGRRKPMDITEKSGLRTSTTYEHAYHAWIMATLHDVFGVKILVSRTRLGSHPYIRNIWIIGESSDVLIASTLFPWLENLFPKFYHKALKQGLVPKSFAGQNGYYYGLYKGIVDNNKRAEAAMPAEDRSKWAMVVVDKQALIEKYTAEKHQVTAPKASRKKYDSRSMGQGMQDGVKIKLRQVSNDSTVPARQVS